jgi:hypothetical protein
LANTGDISEARPVRELARWRFDEGAGGTAADSSGNGHTLTAVSGVTWTTGPSGGAVALDGKTQWLETSGPVVQADQSFSVAAWVRLDGDTFGREVRMAPDVYALTAVSQSGPTHSPFYLGVRLIEEKDVRWCFTLSPEDGVSIEWQHAASAKTVPGSLVDEWVLIVGVSDVSARTTHLYVPTTGDGGVVHMPDAWAHYWSSDGGLQVGQGLFSATPADQWPGSIGEVRVFAGALSSDDVAALASAEA